jgi:uncharacterized protein YndB with AHSA1/START domain
VRADITVRVAASPERVWEVLADVENWPSWTQSMTSITLLDTGPLGVGSRVRIKQPRLPVTTWTVIELSPGESFTWIAAGPGIRTTASHRIHAAEPGSVVTLMVDQNGIIGRLIGKFMAGLTNRYLAMEGHGLKAHAERPSQAP